MKKAIVTTTINSPTEAIIEFARIAAKDDWRFFIVGDKRTPHADYLKIPEQFSSHVVYLSPEWQERAYPKLSGLIDWNCIQRRNIGFLAAYEWGADIIATVDDDNIPMREWGRKNLVGQLVEIEHYTTKQPVFDPFSRTNYPDLWHRGFPVQLLTDKNYISVQAKRIRKILVQADFWNGAPDIDAICRIAHQDPQCEFNFDKPFCSDKIAPFNSQNTFLDRSVMREYFMYPGIGRMDDIWAAYHLQHIFPESVIFSPASVFQRRNRHDFVKDLEAEIDGYKYSLDIAKDPSELELILPTRAREAFVRYQKEIDILDNT